MAWFPYRGAEHAMNSAIDAQMKRSTYVKHWRHDPYHVLLRRKKTGFEAVAYFEGRLMRSHWANAGEEQETFEEVKAVVATAIAKKALRIK